MYISGANNLYNHYPEIDQLNVFPVPDGDTGMNMNLTVTSGSKEIQNRNDDSVSDLALAFSKGLLMGARGNSGVITSQIFRGFAKSLEGKKDITARDLASAFMMAKDVAYKAVMKPVEGTILTVIRESSAALNEHIGKDTSIEGAMDFLLKEALASLQRTPDLLPVLKEVGVVDSGGAGLCRLFEGMDKAVHGEMVQRLSDIGSSSTPTQAEVPMYAGAKLTEGEEGYGYCTQFILRLAEPNEGKKPFMEKKFRSFLASRGKSLVLVRDDNIVKVHVHTLTPGNMLNYAQNFGEFVNITIENMSEEHHNIERGLIATDMDANLALAKKETEKNKEEEKPLDKYALIAVSAGKGLNEIFKELGVGQIVSGGQTMNPSTQDFVDAIKKAHAENVFILPNNSNIVMAASQACDVLEGSKTTARVVPSKTVPQGLVSILQFNPDLAPDEVYRDMKAALRTVNSGSVTYAIKNTEIEGVHITKDYYMAMKDKKIVSCVKDKFEALGDLIDSMVKKDSAILTVLVGEDITPEEDKKILDDLNERYGDQLEVDVKRGDQPVYSFLVGVE